MPVTSVSDQHAWFTELRQNGLLIAPTVLDEMFPDGPDQPSYRRYMQLRDQYNRFATWLDERDEDLSGATPELHRWVDAVLEDFLGHSGNLWLKGPNVPDKYATDSMTGQRLRASRVLLRSDDPGADANMLVWISESAKVGMGRGRKEYGRFLELLRDTDCRLGLMTNGSQFRLCFAGLDHDCWVEWETEDWFEQKNLRPRLHGFLTLLGPSGMRPREDVDFPLLEAIELSRKRQSDLSAVLGERVREAVEALLEPVENACRRDPDYREPLRKAPDGSTLDGRDWSCGWSSFSLQKRGECCRGTWRRITPVTGLKAFLKNSSVRGAMKVWISCGSNNPPGRASSVCSPSSTEGHPIRI